ncbi:MAG: iron-sulfur cluster assembly scaffold protein [Chthoniobacterales bacterium]
MPSNFFNRELRRAVSGSIASALTPNHGLLEHATHRAEGYNALCGDEVTVEAIVKDGVVESVQFQASACAICTASASIMTCEAVKLSEPT